MASQPDREIELGQTNRGVGGVCVRVVPRVQSKLSHALHAHRGKKLLKDLQTQERAAIKRAMVRFRGAQEKGAMTFVECLGVLQEGTMKGPLWRETLGRMTGPDCAVMYNSINTHTHTHTHTQIPLGRINASGI